MALWSAEKELAFLKGLGTWVPSSVPDKGYSKQDLLKKYYNTMHLRHDWDEIDPNRVRGYLRQQGGHK